MLKLSRAAGEAVLLAAVFMAPINAVRPVPGLHLLTVTDALLPIGFLLLLPWLLTRKIDIPLPYAFGALVLIATVVVSSLLSPDPWVSFNFGSRLLAATVVTPLAFLWWRPDIRRMDVLVWAYVGGQVLSTLWGLHEGELSNGRYDGLSTHPNFFSLSGQIAVAFVPYLLERTRPGLKWLVLVVGVLCAYSVVMSGSRASLVVLFILAVIYPLRERSLKAAYAIVTAGVVSWVAYGLLFSHLGTGSAFSRLEGDPTAGTSDSLRHELFVTGMGQFNQRPFAGQGFANALEAHNVYLQVAAAGGIFCLMGFLFVMWSLVAPMFRAGPMGKLGYAALSYALVALVTAALWDRLSWVALALCLVAAVPAYEEAKRAVARPRSDLALAA